MPPVRHRTVAVLARELSNDAVTLARSANAGVVVTGPASPFCHGASALRYWAAGGARLSWRVAGSVERLPAVGRVVVGRLEWEDAQQWLVCRQPSDRGELRIRMLDPRDCGRASRDRVAVALRSGRTGILAMAGRSYDVLNASLMTAGLAEGAARLSGEPVQVARAASGQLVLGTDRLDHARLVALASDVRRAKPQLLAQAAVYRDLDRQWRGCRRAAPAGVADLRAAAAMLHAFFSVLILLHNSYSEVMERCLARLDHRPQLRRATTVAAIPAILRWQLDEVGLFPARKDALEPGSELPVPGFTIDDDLTATQNRVLAARRGQLDEHAAHLVLVSVLKEWKFFLAKALHRHFSVVLRRISVLDCQTAVRPSDALRSVPVQSLIRRLEESGHVG